MWNRKCRVLCPAVVLVVMAVPVSADTVFVDASATGDDTGTSWEHAFPDLQDGLLNALPGDQVWVAAGTYTPDAGALVTAGDRAATFGMKTGVEVYGGFAGNEASLDERVAPFDDTILSGDLAGDDLPGFVNTGENSLHVVSALGVGASALLDGFVIRDGFANLAGQQITLQGAGCYVVAGGLTLRRCTFVDNEVGPTVGTNCRGAGLYAESADLRVDRCVFIRNRSGNRGGAIYTLGGTVRVAHSRFLDNVADNDGGAVYCWESAGEISDCSFVANTAAHTGGGYFGGTDTDIRLANCSFVGNLANLGEGGGVYNHPTDSQTTVVNAILWDNAGPAGVFDEAAQLATDGTGVLSAASSCIQGLAAFGGGGNTGGDPLFVDVDGPDDIPGTEDDDLALAQGSACLDAGDNGAVGADTFDLDGDGDVLEPAPLDLAGMPRFMDGAAPDVGIGSAPLVDMGAREYGVCQDDLGYQGPGTMQLTLCGDPLTSPGTAQLSLTGAPPSAAVFLFIGIAADPTPLGGGHLVPAAGLFPLLHFVLPTSPLGTLDLPVPGSAGNPATIYLQYATKVAFQVQFSNAIGATLGT